MTEQPPVETDRTEPIDLNTEMQRSYIEYAMSVIVSRALPDVRDGLKPVHRRVVYAMYDGGYRPDRGFNKCSRVVGEVRGRGRGPARRGGAAAGCAPEGARVTLADGRALEARRVWSTLPVTALARMVEPAPPAEALAAADALEYRAMALVYLVVPRPRYSPFDAHYLPGGATPVTRVSEPRNYRDGDDPPDVTVLCAEVPCGPDEEAVRRADDDLGRVAVEA